jgi:hypothetical protein
MRCSGLATPENTYGYMEIPGIYRILPLLRPKLFKDSKTPTRSYEENGDMGLGTTTNPGL